MSRHQFGALLAVLLFDFATAEVRLGLPPILRPSPLILVAPGEAGNNRAARRLQAKRARAA